MDYRELAELYKMFTDIRVRARQVEMAKQGLRHPLKALRFASRMLSGRGGMPEAYPPRRCA